MSKLTHREERLKREKAEDDAVEQLKNIGVIVMPVSQNSNYIMANFVTASGIKDKNFCVTKCFHFLSMKESKEKNLYCDCSESSFDYS